MAGAVDRAANPVATAIDGATGDWSMSGDAMRWSPELAERGPAGGDRRLVSGALTSIGSVANDVVTELRQLTRGPSADDEDPEN
jgi:hypothetical protein